jgi:hypothetical protein
MKKLTYLVSAIATGLFSSAHADVSVSGSASVAYSAAGSTTQLQNYGSIGFGLSTTTSSGMTISAGGGFSRDIATATALTGFDGLTFSTGGVTIEVGNDVALSDAVGDLSDVASSVASQEVSPVTNTASVQTDEGAGVGLTTSFGDASVYLAYVGNGGVDGNPEARLDNATITGASAKISTTVGALGVTAAYVTVNGGTDDTETGVAVSYGSSMGTISAGYGSTTGTNDGSLASAAYSLALDADTSVAIGYVTHEVGSTTGSTTEIKLARSLGGGASVFLESVSTNGTVTTSSVNNASGIAVGTSVSF